MDYRTKIALAIGLLLVTAQSLFPPRYDPEHPENKVQRASVFSNYFYYAHYSKSPLKGSENAYLINSSPATIDWARYVTQLLMIGSLTGVACLVISGKRAKPHALQE